MSKRRGLDRHKSSSHPDRKLPPGIQVLVAYAGIISLFYLLYLVFGISQPVSLVFGTFLYGTPATIIELISLGILLAIIYGLIKKHFWVFYISLAWFIFGALNAIISLFRFRSEFDILKSILIISSIVVIILNGIIAWYIYSERNFFKTRHLNKITKAKDKFFVYVISTFLIVSILILVTFGINFYTQTIKTTNNLITELQNDPLPQLHCAQKNVSEQDLCYLVASIMQGSTDKTICENINSDFYKMTCYRALS